MTNFIAGISVLLMLTLSFWGWGSGAARILYGSTFAGWFYPAALGMSVVAVIGGVVNLLGIASPFFLWMIVASGWFLAASASRNFRVDRADLSWLLTLSATCFVLLIFLVATLMPSYVFNFHDDFHNYLARPVRMLQTGTLAGGWFDSLGWDSLGAQAYFQGLTLLVLPLEYTHGFDAVLCSALAVGLAGELSKHLGVHPLFAVAAMTFLILINPMMVNISTLYAGTVVIQGLLFAVLIWNKEMVAQQVRVPWRPSVAIGVFLATIAALKMTLAVFAAFFFFLWLLGALSLFRGKMVVLKSAITTLLAATLAIGPWIVMHKQNLQSALMQFIAGQPDDSDGSGPGLIRLSALFRFWNQDLPYGGKYYYYTLLVAGLLAACIAALILIFRRRNPGTDAALVPALAASGAAVLIYLIFPYQIDLQTAVRYTCPVLLAVVPFTVAATGLIFQTSTGAPVTSSSTRAPIIITCVFYLIVSAFMFGEVLQQRFGTLLEKRTLIAHPVSKTDIDYCTYALGSQAKNNVQMAQEVTEPGTGILSSISQSFHLDFSRNRVFVASDSALLVPWFDFPLKVGMESLRKFLRGRGIRYIIWEHTGYGINDSAGIARGLSHPIPVFRRLASRSLLFRSQLSRMRAGFGEIYNKNYIIVLDLERPLLRSNE